MQHSEETQLVLKLKKFCSSSGRELCPSESAKILHQLGRVYRKRSPDKVCLIQSAALLNAAISRNPTNVLEILEDLQELCTHVLEEAKAVKKETCLIKTAMRAKVNIIKMRAQTRSTLAKIKNLPDDVQSRVIPELEKEKITAIQTLQEDITDKYKAIMKKVANQCETILGELPEKYSLVGMGSLARKEITPFSDFENIILLPDGCQKKNNYADVLEYFRWYAVVFQITLINLKETIIPSVHISSLNDETAPNGDWFFDAITTRGISFDGMMPHACKSPLGRVRKTKDKPWTTELIKPVSEMIKYLDTEENLKNGYHLSDILTKTCFVYGDRSLCDDFQKRVNETMRTKPKTQLEKEIKQQLTQDISNFGTRGNLANTKHRDRFNVKRVVYRSTTLFVSALGAMNNRTASSCFDIIAALKENNAISSKASRKLMYAVALACEIRLKVYMKHNGQDDWIKKAKNSDNKKGDLANTVGKRSVINYFQIAYSLQCDLCHTLNIAQPYFYSQLQLLNLSICYFLGFFNEAAKLSLACLSQINLDTPYQFDSCLEFLEDRISTVSHIPWTKHSKLSKAVLKDSYIQIAPFLDSLGNKDEVLECYRNFLDLSEALPQINSWATCQQKADVMFNTAIILSDKGEDAEALKHLGDSIEITQNSSSPRISNKKTADAVHNKANCLVNQEKYEEALPLYKKVLEFERKTVPHEYWEHDISDTLFNIGNCLLKHQKYEESLPYLYEALPIKRQLTWCKDTNEGLAAILSSTGTALQNIGQHKKSLVYFKEALELDRKIGLKGEKIDFVVDDLRKMEKSLNELGKHKESLVILLQILKEKQTRSESVAEKKDLSEVYGLISLHYHHLKKPQSYHYSALQLRVLEQISVNTAFDEELANVHYRLGKSLQYFLKFREALYHYDKCLYIRNHLSTTAEEIKCQGKIYSDIACCSLLLERYSDSLDSMSKGLRIMRSLHSQCNVIEYESRSYVTIGTCFQAMKSYINAIYFFNLAIDFSEKYAKECEEFSKIFPKNLRCIAESYYNIGCCLESLQCPSEALRYFNIADAKLDQQSFEDETQNMIIRKNKKDVSEAIKRVIQKIKM